MGRTSDKADALMAAVLAAYTAEGVDPPERVAVSFARDIDEADSPTACAVEQLTVHAQSISGGLPGSESAIPLAPRQSVRALALSVRVARCHDATITNDGQAPTVEAVEAAADRTMADMDVLSVAAANIVGGGVFGDCVAVTVGSVQNLGVFGDTSAVGLSVSVQY